MVFISFSSTFTVVNGDIGCIVPLERYRLGERRVLRRDPRLLRDDDRRDLRGIFSWKYVVFFFYKYDGGENFFHMPKAVQPTAPPAKRSSTTTAEQHTVSSWRFQQGAGAGGSASDGVTCLGRTGNSVPKEPNVDVTVICFP